MILLNICNSNNIKKYIQIVSFPSQEYFALCLIRRKIILLSSKRSAILLLRYKLCRYFTFCRICIFLNYYKIKLRHQINVCKNSVVLLSAALIFFINFMTSLCLFRCLNSYISCSPLQNQSV
jgi:hypothetical protein